MRSLEERHAERARRRVEGVGPIEIVKDDEEEPVRQEEEREPMRNKQPGSSIQPVFFEQKVEGDDKANADFMRAVSSEEQNMQSSVSTAVAEKAAKKAAKASAGGEGNGGASESWQK